MRRNIEMKVLSKVILGLVACALVGIAATGCNTFKGAGRDIQRGGQAVENTAERGRN